MERRRIVVSLPNDNAYQHEQAVAAKSAAERLGLELQVMHAGDDSITQSQQLLEIIQSRTAVMPSAFVVEPVTATGLPKVAEAAIARGIAWVVSNNDVDYIKKFRRDPRIPAFIVTQEQSEIGRLQGKQFAVLLPDGGSVLYIEGPSMSSVASQRREGMERTKPQNVQITTLRSKWSEESSSKSTEAWLRLATSRAERYDLVAGQTHELTIGARKSLQSAGTAEQNEKWLNMRFLGIGVLHQVKPLLDRGILTAAVVTSVTLDLALSLLSRAFETRTQPSERTIVESTSLPDLSQLQL
jgi:ribose transport system substrate-binding protein